VQQFIVGFIAALIIVAPAALIFLIKKTSGKTDTLNQNTAEKNKKGKNQSGSETDKIQIEELGKLTGQLAHEIKNPLSTIKVNLKLISEDLKDLSSSQGPAANAEKNQREFTRVFRKIDVLQKETGRLEQILDGFLRYLDRSKLQLSSLDINGFLDDMVDFFSPQAHSHSITIRLGLYSKPLICKVDSDMLKQVVLNLFINAQQAIGDGGELIIRTDKHDQCAVITVSDTGCGIEQNMLPHIFDAYYSSRPQGTGLGLPTAKKIVEAHNGQINVDSEPGKGTSFTIKLPMLPQGGQ